ncbi:MAG: hypothetical protein Q8T09_00780 [Candidatus Melainabacteria bacterium]|nr:hypothetical protein [Candidatus Melainabacteria bacterium]
MEIEILLSMIKPIRHLADLYKGFQESLPSRPKVKLFRSSKKLKISYLSSINGTNYDSYSSREHRIRYKEFDIELQASIDEYLEETSNWHYPERHYEFTVFFKEFQHLFKQLDSTLKKKYDFDCQPLINKLESLQDSLPKDEASLAELIRVSIAAKYAAPEVPVPMVLVHATPLPSVFPVNRYQSKTRYIGVTKTGEQFWGQIIVIYRASLEQQKTATQHYFSVVHKFQSDGTHIDTIAEEIEHNDQDESLIMANAKRRLNELLSSLGDVDYQDIAIRLFETTIAGSLCGLIDTSTEELGDTVTMKPAGLIFSPPWDGSFDT